MHHNINLSISNLFYLIGGNVLEHYLWMMLLCMYHLLLHIVLLEMLLNCHPKDLPRLSDHLYDNWNIKKAYVALKMCCGCMYTDIRGYQASMEHCTLLEQYPNDND